MRPYQLVVLGGYYAMTVAQMVSCYHRVIINIIIYTDIRTQSCNKTDATNQSSWVPDLLRCTNRLPLSEDLYTIVSDYVLIYLYTSTRLC